MMIELDKIFEFENYTFKVYNASSDDYLILKSFDKNKHVTRAYGECKNMVGSVIKLSENYVYDVLFKFRDKYMTTINGEFKILDKNDIDVTGYEISYTGLNFSLLDEI